MKLISAARQKAQTYSQSLKELSSVTTISLATIYANREALFKHHGVILG